MVVAAGGTAASASVICLCGHATTISVETPKVKVRVMASVAILIPTMRAHRLPDVVHTIEESTDDYHIVVIAAGDCAEAARSLPVTLIEDDGGTWPERINRGYGATTEPYIFTAADDLAFRPGWLESALRSMTALPNGSGVVAVNDLHNMAGVHFLIARSYVESLGGYKDAQGTVVYAGFQHQYCDDALRLTAKNRGMFAFATESIVEHMHPGAGKAPSDAVYEIGAATAGHDVVVFQNNTELWQ